MLPAARVVPSLLGLALLLEAEILLNSLLALLDLLRVLLRFPLGVVLQLVKLAHHALRPGAAQPVARSTPKSRIFRLPPAGGTNTSRWQLQFGYQRSRGRRGGALIDVHER